MYIYIYIRINIFKRKGTYLQNKFQYKALICYHRM